MQNDNRKFMVTHEIMNCDGEILEAGWIDETDSLHEAVRELFRTRTNEVGGFEDISLSDYPDYTRVRWITVHNSMEFVTGKYESRTLHFPDHITGASRQRLCKLLLTIN